MKHMHKISITALLVSSVLSVSAFAEDSLQSQSSVENISDLSSTADTPNNLYDFIDNEKLKGVAYAGAELGGSALFGDQTDGNGDDASFEHWDMFKVGADFTYLVNDQLSLLLGGESRYAWSGFDTKLEPQNYVDRFQFGFKTVAGTTTYGKQCGIADVYLGFADISKEFGLGAEGDEVACTDEQFNHHYINDTFDIGVAYEHQNDAWAVGGSFTVGPVVIGGTYLDIGKSGNYQDMMPGKDLSETVYTVGAVLVLDQFNVAAKYAASEMDTNVGTLDTTGYAFGVAYQATMNLSLAATYNFEDYDFSAGALDSDDDWFTVGASYRINEHFEFVTDYKVASEDDDKLFLRLNVAI